ncbi:site-specific integrase [Paucibacter sp. Y2R2-4]|nr:site-specific integrase [Paucibacter sp. Y2R2-4]
MGSIRLLSSRGTLFMDFRFQGQRCREYTALTDTPANRKRLQKALESIEAQIAAGTFDYAKTFPGSKFKGRTTAPPEAVVAGAGLPASAPTESPPPLAARTPTFAEYTKQWMAEHQVEWRRSHIKILNSTLKGHLVPRFGETKVGCITKAEVMAFRADLAALPGRAKATMSNKRINGILAPLRQILDDASEAFGFVSPIANLKPLKIRKADVQPFALDEVQRLLATVRPDYRDYFTVRFFTGLRTGECHGLKWKYVDFENRLILIRETFVLGEDEYTKTDSSQRDIQMTQVVYEALKRQHAATSRLSPYVFCNSECMPLDNKNFSDRVWYPILRHLDLPKRRPYQMRHTAATLWLASGEAPEWIARQLGHASTEMLFRVYSRFVPNLTRRDGSAIDRLLATRFSSGQGESPGAQDGAPQQAHSQVGANEAVPEKPVPLRMAPLSTRHKSATAANADSATDAAFSAFRASLPGESPGQLAA